jgi:polar amino acid transport system substrate-binding protein
MHSRFRLAAMVAVTLLLAACTNQGAASTPTAPAAPTATAAAGTPAVTPTAAPPTTIPGGLLDKIMKAKKLVVSTDPAYPPQSEVQADGTYKGFDIDVATEIAKRLGVTIAWETPAWEAITAGGWGGRWDISVGSMTITPERLKVVTFSVPYYFTPAQMAASTKSGITALEGLAGKTVCAGESTTYYQWLTGTLDFGPSAGGKPPAAPAGVKAVTLPTDRDCALQWKAGRHDFEGWLSSDTTVAQAIKDGLPLVKVGNPVYSEPLAVATDKKGPDPSDFLTWLDTQITALHADGTLSALSVKWFGSDITKDPSKT